MKHELTPFILKDEDATKALAIKLAANITAPFRLYFYGDIGMGKSCFIRAFLKARGIKDKIKSPTFSIIEVYDQAEEQYVHLDLYRMSDIDELHYLGLDDYDSQNTITLVEWPQKLNEMVSPDLELLLNPYNNAKERQIELKAISERGKGLLERIYL